MWKWKNNIRSPDHRQKYQQTKNSFEKFHYSVIQHFRNIRAVCFHPSGDSLFIAAPMLPKEEEESHTTSRYACPSILMDIYFVQNVYV